MDYEEEVRRRLLIPQIARRIRSVMEWKHSGKAMTWAQGIDLMEVVETHGDLIADALAAPERLKELEEVEREACAIAARIFRIRIDGDLSSFSQFSRAYWTWGNGYVVNEVPQMGVYLDSEGKPSRTNEGLTPDALLKLFEDEIRRQRETYDVLVWRRLPRCEQWTEGTETRTRLTVCWHFMKREDLDA